MPAPGALGRGRCFQCRVQAALPLRRFLRGRPGGGLADGIGEGQEVIRARTGRRGRHRQPHDFPAAGDGERVGVLFAQVVAVRFGVSSEGSEDSGGVRVYVRQSGHRRIAAGRPRTQTNCTHDITDYSPCSRVPRIETKVVVPRRDGGGSPEVHIA